MHCKQKDRFSTVSPNSFLFDQTAAPARPFRFLRQPRRPNAPRPVANSGNAAGSGVAEDTTKLSNAGFGVLLSAEKSTLTKFVNEDGSAKVVHVLEIVRTCMVVPPPIRFPITVNVGEEMPAGAILAASKLASEKGPSPTAASSIRHDPHQPKTDVPFVPETLVAPKIVVSPSDLFFRRNPASMYGVAGVKDAFDATTPSKVIVAASAKLVETNNAKMIESGLEIRTVTLPKRGAPRLRY